MEENSNKETRVVQTAGKGVDFSLPKIYVDCTKLDGEKIEWSIMMMDQDFILDIRDALSPVLESIDKRIKNACQNALDPSYDADLVRKLSQKKYRLQLMIKLIQTELDGTS